MTIYADMPSIDDEPFAPPAPERELPPFEGQTVHETKVKMASCPDVDMGSEDPLRIDQTIRMLVTARVARVDHVVNDKTGHLQRVHTLKVVDAMPVAWDEVAHLALGDL